MNPGARITAEKIAAFTDVMRTNVLTGDVAFRRAYIRSIIDNVEVDDGEIRIHGRRTVLERLVMGGGKPLLECPVLFVSGAPGKIQTSDPRIRRLRGVCRPAVAQRDQVRTMTAGCESATALPVRPICPLQHAGVSFGIREPFWWHDW